MTDGEAGKHTLCVVWMVFMGMKSPEAYLLGLRFTTA